MTLKEYMFDKRLDDAAMAALVGDISRSQISRLRRGKSRPSWLVADRIEIATKGKVKRKDW